MGFDLKLMSENLRQRQLRWDIVKLRLTNLPVVILLLINLAVTVFYYNADAWRGAFDPQVLKPLMAAATAISLVLYFFIGNDGLKLLLAVTILASIAIVAHMIIEWRTPVADFAVEVVRRIFWVLMVLCLCLWDRDREAQARSTTNETTEPPGKGSAPASSK